MTCKKVQSIRQHFFKVSYHTPKWMIIYPLVVPAVPGDGCRRGDYIYIKGRLYHFSPKFAHFFCTCHNFFPFSSVQIIIIPNPKLLIQPF